MPLPQVDATMPNRTACTDKGFTLLEVMLAVFVLSAAALGFFASHWYSVRLDMASQQDEIAMTTARTHLERIKATSFTTLLATWNNTLFPVTSLEPIDGVDEAGSVVVAAVSANLLEVTVTIQWKGTSGNEVFELIGLVSRY